MRASSVLLGTGAAVATVVPVLWWMAGGPESFVRWLREPLFPTRDTAVADSSPWQYGEEPGQPGVFTTSRLGIVNGYLPRLPVPLVLTAHYDPDSNYPQWPYLSLRKKWW